MRALRRDNWQDLVSVSDGEISRRLALKLQNDEVVRLRDNYVEQLQFLLRGDTRLDTGWLSEVDGEFCFITRNGETLRVVHADEEHMHIVMDQSGSMQSIQSAVYQGAKELVESLPEDSSVIFSTFSSSVSIGPPSTRDAIARILDQVPVARGSTRLRDAIIMAIDHTTPLQSPRRTIVVVTDGCDTASERSLQEVSSAIASFSEQPGSRILFLGSNQDAVLAAGHFGIPVHRALTVSNNGTGFREAFRAVSEEVSRNRTTQSDGFLRVERQRTAPDLRY